MGLISAADRKRISEAIAEAERTTSGEIVCVIAGESDSYMYAPFMWAALLALLIPWPLIYLTWWPVQWIYALQLLVFLLLLLATLPRNIRLKLVPRSLQRTRAHRRAVEQFIVQNLHTTAGRTGVLIFISVAERYAEILADHAIHEKVAPGTWQTIVDRLTGQIGAGRTADGFVDAIAAVGKLLSEHFPPGTNDPNELPNHLIVIE
jgi:putative membrane protein